MATEFQEKSPFQIHVFDGAIKAVDRFQNKVESHGTFAPKTVEKDGKSYVGSLFPTLKLISEERDLLKKTKEGLSDKEIAESTREEIDDIRDELRGLDSKHLKEALDSYLPQVFAQFGEAVKETLGFEKIYDSQLRTAIAMHEGKAAELPTGEGKTVAIGHATALNALAGKGVHVITANDYLARRDAANLGEAYQKLGISVAVILSQGTIDEQKQYIYDPNSQGDDPDFPHLREVSRKEAYMADVTYGIDHAFMTDALIDEMPENIMNGEKIQRLYIAFVDEADDGIIDKAENPHILGGFETITDKEKHMLAVCNTIAQNLEVARLSTSKELLNRETADLQVLNADQELLATRLSPTSRGAERIWDLLVKNHLIRPNKDFSSFDDLYDGQHNDLLQALDNAFRAQYVFRRGDHYNVTNGQVHIIDKELGRYLSRNRLQDGMHQALEAKEGVEIMPDMITINEIGVPEYMKRYERRGFTSGSLTEAAGGIFRIYKMDVVQIPPSFKSQLVKKEDKPRSIFARKDGPAGLFAAAVESAAKRHETGQPVIIFAQSQDEAQEIGWMLKERLGPKETVEILDADQTAKEAYIISQAGKLNAITVVTQMAGRGVDIIPGGKLEIPTFEEFVKRQNHGGLHSLVPLEEAYNQEVARLTAEHEKVNQLGGPHLILAGKDDKKRLTRQKKGRTARLGAPGSYEELISWQDKLFESMEIDTEYKKELLKDWGLMLPDLSKAKTREEYEALKAKRDEIIRSPKYQRQLDAFIESLQQKNATHQTDSLVSLSERQDIVAEVRRAYHENLKKLSEDAEVTIYMQQAVTDVIDMAISNPVIFDKPISETPEGKAIESTADRHLLSESQANHEEKIQENKTIASLDLIFDLELSKDEIQQIMKLSSDEMRQEFYLLAIQKLKAKNRLESGYIRPILTNHLTRAWQDFLGSMPTQYNAVSLTEGMQPGTLSTRLRQNVKGLLNIIAQDMDYNLVKDLFEPEVKIQQVLIQPTPLITPVTSETT